VLHNCVEMNAMNKHIVKVRNYSIHDFICDSLKPVKQ
jgi:hypothetical protein